MIKLFSPEAFNDYDDIETYGCIIAANESRFTLVHEQFKATVEHYYTQLLNSNWPGTDAFLNKMAEKNYIIKGEGSSEIVNYNYFIGSLYDCYTLPEHSSMNTDSRAEEVNTFINTNAFEQYVIENQDKFEDRFLPATWFQELMGTNIVSSMSGKDGNINILNLTNFKNELMQKLKTKTQVELDKVLSDKENGITFVKDDVLLFYIFEVCLAEEPERYIGGVNVFINQSGEIIDTDEYLDVIQRNVIPGFEFFGIGKRTVLTYYLDYNAFEEAIENVDPEKTVSVSPQTFVNEEIAKKIITYIPRSSSSGRDKYRIENVDIFLTNYSIYRIGVNVSNLDTNGDMVLLPSLCDIDAEINGPWSITLNHDYDEDGRSSYIQKGCVLAIPMKIAREQTYENQLFRVYDVQNSFNGVEVTAYPVAQESKFECPVDLIYYENVTASQLASALTAKYPEKYLIVTDIDGSGQYIYAKNSNLQEIIAGGDEATFINAFGGELIYDNYIYRLLRQSGRKIDDSKDYTINYKANMKGIKVIENTFDITTRIYPTSSEGYNMDSVMNAYRQYTDEYGPLTQKVPVKYHFNFNELVYSLDEFVKSKPNYDPTVFRSETSSNIAVSSEIEEELILYFGANITINLPTECTRLCTELVNQGVLVGYGPNGETVAKIESGWAGVGPTPSVTTILVTPQNYIDFDFVLCDGKYNNTVPLKFYEGLRKLSHDFLPHFLEVEYAIEPVYPEVIPRYIDAANIRNYPFVHAQSIAYDNITLVNRYDASENREMTESERAVDNAMAAITAAVETQTKKYIKLAHEGRWNHKKRIKTKSKTYDYSTGNASKIHLHTNRYNPRTDRIRLPYGYILYSFKDAIEYLKHEAVLSWCADEEEAEIFCEAIENGFKWCEKTNIAKWMWHTKGKDKYYGTKTKTNYIQNAYHHLDGKWYWFNGKGYIRRGNANQDVNELPLSDYSEFKWVDDPVEETVTEGEGENAKEKKVTKHRYRFQNEKGEYLRDCWIEENKSKHYYVETNGYRKSFKVENGTDGDGKTVYKEIDYDDEEWTFLPGAEGETFRLTGWRYGNHKKGNYPVNGQFMYIKDYKGWFRFVDSKASDEPNAATYKGTIQGNYLSDATWSWKKYKKGWRFTDGNRSYLTWQWAKIDGKWYFFAPKGGYVDTTTDDFSENSKSFNTESKHPDIDYNREGVSSVGTTTDSYAEQTTDSYNEDRDGVQAWIQKDLIKEVKKVILQQHMALWDGLRNQLWWAASSDIEILRNESLSVEVDFEQLANYDGYEDLTFLKDLYLGDYVHVVSSIHGFEGDLRVVGMKYDCLTNQPKTLTLGYPTNSFISRNAKLNSSGSVKFYSAIDYVEDGFGDFIEDGTVRDPQIPIK